MEFNFFRRLNFRVNRLVLFASILFLSAHTNAQRSTLNIVDFGADPTGKTNSSHIINQLVDSLANNTGGTIYIPAGKFLCGPIFLKSNITLYTENGAEIHFTDNFNDYLPMVTSHWEGVRVKTFASQIYAIDAHNINIEGKGHFEGHGQKWWDTWFDISRNNIEDTEWQKLFNEANRELLVKNAYIKNMHSFLRPPMVMFYNCKNITIEGVSFSNPPFWTIVPTYCENVTIDNITIENPGHSPNTDGIDPCSCKNVRISNSHISVGDDCIVLKSGRDEDGLEAAMPTENITITNCTMLNGHGGVVIGSEMSGDVKRVTISNCVFEGTDRGIRIKSMRGRGGIVEDIRVSNIVMRDIVKEGLMINMRYHTTPVEELSERTPEFRRIHFSDINITNAKNGIAIYGLEERSVDQISFSDIYLQSEKGIYAQYVNNLSFDKITIETSADVPVILDQCNKVNISALNLMNPSDKATAVQVSNSENIKISECFQPAPIATFLKVDDNSKKVYLLNNILSESTKIIEGKNQKSVIQVNTLQ